MQSQGQSNTGLGQPGELVTQLAAHKRHASIWVAPLWMPKALQPRQERQ